MTSRGEWIESDFTEPKSAPACIFVLLGATGDLAARKIAPALYNLKAQGLLDDRTVVLGVARRPRSDEQFRREMLEAIRQHSRTRPIDEKLWATFSRCWHYHVTHAESPNEFQTLRQRLEELDKQYQIQGRRLFYLAIRITPEEGINLVFDAKVPGVRPLLRPVKMDFQYETAFASASPEAYEHLLLEAMQGDQTLFLRDDEVAASWRFIDCIRSRWDTIGRPKLLEYAPGSWGPSQADALFENPYIHWQIV